MDESAYYSRESSPFNNSVLTEDTDDYIVGDRVWVNGTKAGYIQYIGEPKFAKGEWAGVVLDEPVGKNDGSVGGTQYFQCEPKRGIFARLNRLTRYPVGEDGHRLINYDHGRIIRNRTTTPDLKTRITTTRVTSTPKIPHYALPARPSKVVTTITTTTTTHDNRNDNIRIGDKVIVNSSRGIQTGRARYVGKTSFASGQWVGVELDGPYGKNDGSVDGKRYFTCSYKYGLFAPIYKVVKGEPTRTITKTRVINTNDNTTGWKPTQFKI